MASFRGSDEILDREIETLEAMGRLRVRRYARELLELERELRELKAEKARRRVRNEIPGVTDQTAGVEAQ